MPYNCQLCSKTFRYKVSLKNHKCNPSSESSKGSPSAVRSAPLNGKKDDEFDMDEFIAQTCDKMGILEHEQSVTQFAGLNINNSSNDGFNV